MIKSSKNYKAQRARADSWIKAEDDAALKNPVMTYSAQMPAYAYTSLCPDPKLRKVQKGILTEDFKASQGGRKG